MKSWVQLRDAPSWSMLHSCPGASKELLPTLRKTQIYSDIYLSEVTRKAAGLTVLPQSKNDPQSRHSQARQWHTAARGNSRARNGRVFDSTDMPGLRKGTSAAPECSVNQKGPLGHRDCSRWSLGKLEAVKETRGKQCRKDEGCKWLSKHLHFRGSPERNCPKYQ